MRSRWGWLRPGHLGSEADRATFRTLHTASLAAPPLRAGLTEASARASPSGTCASCSARPPSRSPTPSGCWRGTAGTTTTRRRPPGLAAPVVSDGGTSVGDPSDISCGDPGARCGT